MKKPKRNTQKEYREKGHCEKGVLFRQSWYPQPTATGADIKTIDPNGATVGLRIADKHGLPRRAIYATLGKN